MEVKLTNVAQEKYDLLNGDRNLINDFFDELIDKKIKKSDLEILFELKGRIFYYRMCASTYIILSKDEDAWVVVDFLTAQEYENIKK